MKILVTGAAGFIGSHLCDLLVEEGHEVWALDDLSVGRTENLAQAQSSERLHFVQGDILNLPSLPWSEFEQVYHLAVACLRVSFKNPRHVHDVNATGTLLLLEACRACTQLQHFLYVSSSEVYGTALEAPMDEHHPLYPTTVYGSSKLAGELYTRVSGLPHTILRPFNSYGPREHHEGASGEVIPRFAVRIANGLAPIIFGDGSQTRDFTYVKDTVQGMLAAAKATPAGKTYNLARGQEVSIAEIARLLLEKMGKAGLSCEFQAPRPADVQRHFADVKKAEQQLHFLASTSISEGLDLYLDWLSQQDGATGSWLKEVAAQNW